MAIQVEDFHCKPIYFEFEEAEKERRWGIIEGICMYVNHTIRVTYPNTRQDDVNRFNGHYHDPSNYVHHKTIEQ